MKKQVKLLAILVVAGLTALTAASPAFSAQSVNGSADSQSVGGFIDDTAITAGVKGNILMEKGLSSFNISVETVDGVVTLTGEVASKELADKAEAAAAQVKGVKRVDNKLTVKP